MQQPRAVWFLVLAAWITGGALALAADLGGRYVGEQDASLNLTLRESPEGRIEGTLGDSGASVPIVGRRQGAGISGTVGPADQAVPFTAALEGDRLVLDIGPPDGGERLAFQRWAGEAAPSAGQRNVSINGKRLSDGEVAQAEATYRLRIPDADYWYDRVLGAWGALGGPTLGFVQPGLDLGGELPPDASGGGTAVFVNGRELHPYDLRALQLITGPILPGRYFITAPGLAGYEGGPPLWDLAAMAAQTRRGGSTSWQTKFSSGISDGQTIGVFLPNGGIVSTGP
jgi:hypothetical protein